MKSPSLVLICAKTLSLVLSMQEILRAYVGRSRGSRNALQPCSPGSLSIPLLCPPPPTSGSHTITHTFSAYPLPSALALALFLYRCTQSQSLPNNYFPGTIRLCSAFVTQPECGANKLHARMDLTLPATRSENSATGPFAIN